MGPDLTRRDVLKLLALLPLVDLERIGAVGRALAQPASQALPNIVVLVFDTLSANHLPFHGYPRLTAPNLARFAEGATVFHAHYSAGNFTTPGTASLLTGTYPWSHRALHIQGRALDIFDERSIFSLLADRGYHRLAYTHNIVTSSLLHQFAADIDLLQPVGNLALADFNLAEQLFPGDFTAAVHGESLLTRRGDTFSSSLLLRQLSSFWQALQLHQVERQHSEEFPRGLPGGHNLHFLLEDAIDWTMQQLSLMPQPFIAYLHYLPPHDPYNPRREFVDRFDDGWAPQPKPHHPLSDGLPQDFLDGARREYDEHIAYVDAEFGRLHAFLQDSGLLDTSYVMVTSDHGELFERGIWNHITPVLFEPVIRVPLIVSAPGQREGRAVSQPTSCVDIVPTLLQIAGLQRPAWCEGEVLPLATGEGPVDRNVYCLEAKRSDSTGPLGIRSVALLREHYKLVHYAGYEAYDDVHELYDLREDPDERNNIFGSRRDVADELASMLAAKWGQVGRAVDH